MTEQPCEAVVLLRQPVAITATAAALREQLQSHPEATVRIENEAVAVCWGSESFCVRVQPVSGADYSEVAQQILASNGDELEDSESLALSQSGFLITSSADVDEPDNAILFTLHACNDGFDGEVFDARLNEFLFHGEPRSIDELLEAARDSDPEQREFAADELGRHGDKRAHEALLQMAQDSDEGVRAIVALALGYLDSPTVDVRPTLLLLAEDSDEQVREFANQALEDLGN